MVGGLIGVTVTEDELMNLKPVEVPPAVLLDDDGLNLKDAENKNNLLSLFLMISLIL